MNEKNLLLQKNTQSFHKNDLAQKGGCISSITPVEKEVLHKLVITLQNTCLVKTRKGCRSTRFQQWKNLFSVRIAVKKHKNLIPSLISLHSHSEYNTVSNMLGIGKAKALSPVEKFPLQLLCRENAHTMKVIKEAKPFVAQCYRIKETSLSKNRFCSNIFSLFLFHENYYILISVWSEK